MAQLLTLQDTVTATTSHPGHVEQLRTINHMVICKLGLEEHFDRKSFDLRRILDEPTYPPDEPHIHPWPPPGSKDCLHPPTMLR